jgi:hypothetical protein
MSSVPVVYSANGSYNYYTFQSFQTQQYLSYKTWGGVWAYAAEHSHDIWIESADSSIVAGQQVNAGDPILICSEIVFDCTLNPISPSSEGYLNWVAHSNENYFQLTTSPGPSSGGIVCGQLVYIATADLSSLLGPNSNDGYYFALTNESGSASLWAISPAS